MSSHYFTDFDENNIRITHICYGRVYVRVLQVPIKTMCTKQKIGLNKKRIYSKKQTWNRTKHNKTNQISNTQFSLFDNLPWISEFKHLIKYLIGTQTVIQDFIMFLSHSHFNNSNSLIEEVCPTGNKPKLIFFFIHEIARNCEHPRWVHWSGPFEKPSTDSKQI